MVGLGCNCGGGLSFGVGGVIVVEIVVGGSVGGCLKKKFKN